MPQKIQIQLSPREAELDHVIAVHAARALAISPNDISKCIVERRSIDARGKNIKILLSLCVVAHGEQYNEIPDEDRFMLRDVRNAEEVHIVGSGPAGLFAALSLIENGMKPVILERGLPVESRKKDVAALNTSGLLAEDSNWCFGEGGAGTFTDGKLYTRSTKRGNVKKIINTFVEFGADKEIRELAHPHIGTDKLPAIVTNIRQAIIDHGGEFRFSTKVKDIEVAAGAIVSIRTEDGFRIPLSKLILACGHSARDMYAILQRREIALAAKPFAIGVRVEHPQGIIDSMQYRSTGRGEYLPPAEYSFAEQVDGRGVYSFCMCPGGVIVPAATSQGELVVNGMSNSKRNLTLANAGLVCEIRLDDIRGAESNPLAGIEFQRQIEQACFEAGGGNFRAPAQRLADFVNKNQSQSLGNSSYNPGLVSCKVGELLPKAVAVRLADALKAIGKKKKEFFTNDALIIAPETRTSSPVFICRDSATLQSTNCQGLYPCGEGAGYAGGIVSAAIDGANAGQKIALG